MASCRVTRQAKHFRGNRGSISDNAVVQVRVLATIGCFSLRQNHLPFRDGPALFSHRLLKLEVSSSSSSSFHLFCLLPSAVMGCAIASCMASHLTHCEKPTYSSHRYYRLMTLPSSPISLLILLSHISVCFHNFDSFHRLSTTPPSSIYKPCLPHQPPHPAPHRLFRPLPRGKPPRPK